MTVVLNVVSTITTVPGSGKILLGGVDLDTISVGAVKRRVEQTTGVSANLQKLWWRGYILDDDSQPLTKACVGVNKDERIDSSLESLVLFMTVDIEPQHRMMVRAPSSPSFRKLRSPSLDLETVKQEFRKSQLNCVVS